MVPRRRGSEKSFFLSLSLTLTPSLPPFAVSATCTFLCPYIPLRVLPYVLTACYIIPGASSTSERCASRNAASCRDCTMRLRGRAAQTPARDRPVTATRGTCGTARRMDLSTKKNQNWSRWTSGPSRTATAKRGNGGKWSRRRRGMIRGGGITCTVRRAGRTTTTRSMRRRKG